MGEPVTDSMAGGSLDAGALVIGADGGNSKTDLVLATCAGDVLARVSGAGTRPHIDGLPVTTAGLVELGRAALTAAGVEVMAPVKAASYFLANVDLPDEEEAMHAALTAHVVAEAVEVRNDTFAPLLAGAERGWGIAVVGGAGINAAGRYPDGRDERFLGIGAISGDWGGGWGIAVAAVGAAVRAVDGRGPSTALCELVQRRFGRDPEAAAVAAHRGQIPLTELIGFAPDVLAAAADGDPVAAGIVARMADEVVDFVRALVHRMQLADSDAEVVLAGGTLQAGHDVLVGPIRRQIAALGPSLQVRVLDVPPVVGALASALRAAGADDAAIARARAQLATTGRDPR